jgi:DNA-binding CsgD family transcriptional regulator
MGTAERGLAEARAYAGSDPDLLIEIDVDALRVASIVGRLPVVLQIGQALLTRLDPRGGRHDEQLLETHLRLAQTLLDEGRWQDAGPHIETAASLIDAGDTCHVTRLELWSSVLDRLSGDVVRARTRAANAADLARRYDYQADLVCCALLYEGRAWLPDDAQKARARWQEALDYADTHGVRLWRGRILAELAMLEADELRRLPGEVDLTLKEADSLAGEFGGVSTQARVALTQARLQLIRGNVDGANEALTRAEGLGVSGAPPRRAQADLRAALAVMRAEATTELTAEASVLVALITDDVEAARSAATDVDRSAGRGALSLFVDLVDARDDSYGAVVDARALLPDLAAAVERLEAAPLVAALFTRLHATGSATERDLLHAAVATFDRTGLVRPGDACRAMLRAAGVPLPRRPSAQDGVPADLRTAGVTTRELDVLRLIAEGKSNKDVAEALYLSPRTVEKHVERLLLKTGVANRSALAALIGRS